MHYPGFNEGDREGASTLTTFTCRCGYRGQIWLRETDPRLCLDCRAEARREADGGVRVFQVVTA